MTKTQNNLKKATQKDVSPLAASLQSFKNSQNTETIKYKDIKGNQHTKKITLTDPGIRYEMRANNLMQTSADTSNIPELWQLIMDNVIITPKLSFESQEKSLPKSLKTKTIPATNKNGEKISLHFAWPGYREAIHIVNEVFRPNGGLNMVQVLTDLENYVFKDDSGRAVTDKYFDAGGHAFGLGDKAMQEAPAYLAKVLNHDGFASIVNKGISFLTTTVRQ